MSVDERLRAAFRDAGEDWQPLPPTTSKLRHQARRRARNARLAVVAAAAAGAVGAGLLSTSLSSDRSQVPAPEPTVNIPSSPTSSSSPSDSSSPHGLIATAVNGSWRSGPLEPADIAHTLESAGLGEYAASILGQLPEHAIVLDLRISGRIWELKMSGRDAPTIVMDQELISNIDEQDFTMGPVGSGNSGESTYTYDVRKRTLLLTFVDTTEPDSSGAPGEAWQRALYTTAGFAKR